MMLGAFHPDYDSYNCMSVREMDLEISQMVEHLNIGPLS
jgi:hypothetical protein